MADALDFHPSRRSLIAGAASIAALGASACAKRDEATGFGPAPKWLALLGQSEKGGRDYAPHIEGEIPSNLRGSLYRNGPGLFERGGARMRHLLDGDGLIQRLSFTDKGVRYQNKFVATKKFVGEEKAGKRLHPTWTTRKPGGAVANFGPNIITQAGVTVYPVHGKIIARDETGPSYDIDPETLDALGARAAGEGLDHVGFKAHSKVDPDTGDWILAGNEYGRKMKIHVALYDKAFAFKSQFSFETPRQVYIHDFFATKKYLVFILHPCFFNPVPFLAGLKSFTDSLDWRGGEGNIVAVVPRGAGEPKFFDAPGAYMWHALNAYEDRGQIIADFVGYDAPDHFIGPDAQLHNIMTGRLGRAQYPGRIRRYRIDLDGGKLTEEIVDPGNHEFPMTDLRAAMSRARTGYFTSGGTGVFNSGVKRIDYETGAADNFDFGPETHVGEAVFAERAGGAMDEGWLIAECLDGASAKTFFAVFDAGSVGQGPIAKIWLEHAAPLSFHGGWTA